VKDDDATTYFVFKSQSLGNNTVKTADKIYIKGSNVGGGTIDVSGNTVNLFGGDVTFKVTFASDTKMTISNLVDTDPDPIPASHIEGGYTRE
jgi:hypothetical protein